LFRKETWKRWNALKDHVRKGCLSDPPPERVSLYYVVGKKRDGMDRYSCARGTSDLEGFHQKLATVLMGKNVSPEIAMGQVKEFVSRWNLNQEVTMYGLPSKYVGHSEQHLIERIQLLTSGWYEEALYPEWRSTKDFAPTGESFGVVNQQRHHHHQQ
jgi:hypothetical protein